VKLNKICSSTAASYCWPVYVHLGLAQTAKLFFILYFSPVIYSAEFCSKFAATEESETKLYGIFEVAARATATELLMLGIFIIETSFRAAVGSRRFEGALKIKEWSGSKGEGRL